MHLQATVSRGEICVARGYGLKIHVHRGHLVVEDGVGRDRHTRRYNRVTGKLDRLVVIGHTGYITLEALRWLRDVDAGMLHIDEDGRLVAASAAAGPDLAALRRAQAVAAETPLGVEVARSVLAAKLSGQRANLDLLPRGATVAAATIDGALTTISRASELAEIRLAESQAADAYWDAWSELPIVFSAANANEVPEHWLRVGQRRSLLTGRPRKATGPAGAMLNYLYALLEGETTLACHAVGLDPSVGIVHADRRSRASLALDLMEAARPLVDRHVLQRLTRTVATRRDFIETHDGACRLNPRLAGELAELIRSMRRPVAQIVEHAAHLLAAKANGRVPRLTPLTRANYQAGWDKRRAAGPEEPRPATRSCASCGVAIPLAKARLCDPCRAAKNTTRLAENRSSALAVLARMRAEHQDPAHGGEAGQRRAAKNATHQRANHEWAGEPTGPATFTREILPGLQHLTVADIAASTGLSPQYCRLIRQGERVPHPRRWAAFVASPMGEARRCRAARCTP